jgi:hypothetical protein
VSSANNALVLSGIFPDSIRPGRVSAHALESSSGMRMGKRRMEVNTGSSALAQNACQHCFPAGMFFSLGPGREEVLSSLFPCCTTCRFIQGGLLFARHMAKKCVVDLKDAKNQAIPLLSCLLSLCFPSKCMRRTVAGCTVVRGKGSCYPRPLSSSNLVKHAPHLVMLL